MPRLLVFQCRLVSLAFERVDVHHHRMINVFYLFKRGDKSLGVVSVIDINIIKTHGFEKVIRSSAIGLTKLPKPVIHAAVVFGNGALVIIEDDDKV